MLTEAEKEWLERRKNLCTRCSRTTSCREGKRHGFNTYKCRFWEASTNLGALRESFRDAAEFEARVARRLSLGGTCADCKTKPHNCPLQRWPYAHFQKTATREECAECRMRHARLAVEADMDA